MRYDKVNDNTNEPENMKETIYFPVQITNEENIILAKRSKVEGIHT